MPSVSKTRHDLRYGMISRSVEFGRSTYTWMKTYADNAGGLSINYSGRRIVSRRYRANDAHACPRENLVHASYSTLVRSSSTPPRALFLLFLLPLLYVLVTSSSLSSSCRAIMRANWHRPSFCRSSFNSAGFAR